jgi:hypothetical protein
MGDVITIVGYATHFGRAEMIAYRNAQTLDNISISL